MVSLPTVFISYNPHSEVEQTLALRLHTIGAVHGFNMVLPDRSINSQTVSNETKARILSSDFFILFSTVHLSKVVQDEIQVAFSKHKDRSKILVVYDKSIGKNLAGAENCIEVYIDKKDDALAIVTSIAKRIKEIRPNTDSTFLSTLAGILLIGVGLFAMAEILSPPQKPPRKASPRKKKKKVNA